MKILLTVHQFFPAYGAGTEVLTLSVARELRRRGHEVHIFTGHPGSRTLGDEARFDQYALDGFPVYRFHHAYAPMGGQQVVAEIEYDNHLAARHFGQVLEEVGPDLVHFFHLGRLGAGLVDLTVARGVPAYYTPTDFWAVCPFQQLMLEDGSACGGPSPMGGNCVRHMAIRTSSWPLASAMKLMPDRVADWLTAAAANGKQPAIRVAREAAAVGSRRAFTVARMNALRKIFSPTKLMTEALVANGVRPDVIEDLPYGIDVSNFEARPRSVERREGGLAVGFIGTLLPHKGCHILVEAFQGLPPGAARLEIYGKLTDSPDYIARLQKLAAGSDAIRFGGAFPHADLPDVLAGLDVLVVPSLWHENTPLVVHAALAARCPVVGSNYRGITEIVRHDRNGLVFEPGDVQDLRHALRRLVDDAGLLARLSANCEPPKSVRRYVSELLDAFAAEAPRRQREGIPDHEPVDE